MTNVNKGRLAAILGGAAACLWTPFAAHAETWGVLIGVSKYHNAQISSLRYPAADAAALKETLTSPTIGKIAPDHIKLLTDDDATGENIKKAITEFLSTHVKPGDDVIVSLAGHGVCKGVGLDARSYFLPTDVRGLSTAAMEGSAVNVKSMATELSRLPAKQFVILVDACREDPTPGRGLKGNNLTDKLSSDCQIVPPGNSSSTASATFFACRIGERAFEDPSYQHGVFTYFVLDGIKQAASVGEPSGEVKMELLANYVRKKVREWGEQKNKEGEGVEQQPELRCLGETPKTVLIRGLKQSSTEIFPTDVETVFGDPLAKFMMPAPSGPAADQFQKAQQAERESQWEVAKAGYKVAMESDPKYAPAYDRLADLYTREGNLAKATDTLLQRNKNIPPDAHSYSLLARCYAEIARKRAMTEGARSAKTDAPEKRDNISVGGIKLPGNIFGGRKKKKKEEDAGETAPPAAGGDAGEFRVTENAREAAQLSLKAARMAQEADPKSSEAKQALGFALIASDEKGANREETLDVFGRAVFLDNNNPEAHYGLGYALDHFALYDKEETQQATLKQAVTSLETAVKLRPNYYDALRELAYCHHMLGQKQEAKRDYEQANANRGQANDPNEVAGLDVALSQIYGAEANAANGNVKQALLGASQGYLQDARDPDLGADMKLVLTTLVSRGLGGVLQEGLDRTLLAPLRNATNSLGSLGSSIHIPGFRFP